MWRVRGACPHPVTVHATLVQDAERQALNSHLAPLLVPAYNSAGGKNLDSVPQWLQVRGQNEWPDFWVARHQESVVLEVKGDVRCGCCAMLGSSDQAVKTALKHDPAALWPGAAACTACGLNARIHCLCIG